jgi:hypothetical protein
LTLSPDALILGASATATVGKGAFGGTLSGGAELLFSYHTFRAAVYGFIGSGVSFFGTNGLGVSTSLGYKGVAYRCPTSSNYEGGGLALSFSLGALPGNVVKKLSNDLGIAFRKAVGLSKIPDSLASVFNNLANSSYSIAGQNVVDQTLNLGVSFGDPNTVSATLATSKNRLGTPSSSPLAIGAANYWQVFPSYDVKFQK